MTTHTTGTGNVTPGIHHITAIAGDAQTTVEFYVGVLGMRLVKKSVNQDSPDTYHLFFADGAGNPGTDLTFFPWPNLPPVRPGVGQWGEVSLGVPVGIGSGLIVERSLPPSEGTSSTPGYR